MFVFQLFSAVRVLQIAVALYVVSTLLTPWLAVTYGALPVFVARVIMGLGEGFILPSCNSIIATWFPSTERSTAVSLFTTGNQLAGGGGNPVAAALCASEFGWPSIFYFAGGLATIWSVIWFLSTSEHPSKCKIITKAEKLYLEENVAKRVVKSAKKQPIPYRTIFTSSVFLAQLQCHFIINFLMTLLQIYLPAYFKNVLQLGVIANGTYTSIPNIFNFTVKITYGIMIDSLKERKIVKKTTAVKVSQAIANFGCATCCLLVAFTVDCTNPFLGFCLFCTMYACMGTFVSGFYTSLLTIAPKYTAPMSAVSVFFSMLGRLITPAIVGMINKNDTLYEWQLLFSLAALLSALSGLIFIFFGSGDLQEWGRDDEKVAELKHLNSTTEEIVEEVDEEEERFRRRVREDSICI